MKRRKLIFHVHIQLQQLSAGWFDEIGVVCWHHAANITDSELIRHIQWNFSSSNKGTEMRLLVS
jgi:hypothetical protein